MIIGHMSNVGPNPCIDRRTFIRDPNAIVNVGSRNVRLISTVLVSPLGGSECRF